MSTKAKPTPFSKAWTEYSLRPSFIVLINVSTLKPGDDKYLANRLEDAFKAGWVAREQSR